MKKLNKKLIIDCEKIVNQNPQNLEDIKIFKTSTKEFEEMIYSEKVICSFSISIFFKARKITNNFTNFNF